MAVFQPTRRARTKARKLALALARIARADERPLYEVCAAADITPNALGHWTHRSPPTLTTAIALADAVGYEIILRRKGTSNE